VFIIQCISCLFSTPPMVARIARSLNFFYRILNISSQNLKDKSLTSKVKENISSYEVPNTFIKNLN
jgi:hypothetical protein